MELQYLVYVLIWSFMRFKTVVAPLKTQKVMCMCYTLQILAMYYNFLNPLILNEYSVYYLQDNDWHKERELPHCIFVSMVQGKCSPIQSTLMINIYKRLSSALLFISTSFSTLLAWAKCVCCQTNLTGFLATEGMINHQGTYGSRKCRKNAFYPERSK